MFDFESEENTNYIPKAEGMNPSSNHFNYNILEPWGKQANLTSINFRNAPSQFKSRQMLLKQNTFDFAKNIKRKPYTSSKSPRPYKILVADITLIPKQSQSKIQQRKNSKLRAVKSRTFSKFQSQENTKSKSFYELDYEKNSKQTMQQPESKQLFFNELKLKEKSQKAVSQGHSRLCFRTNKLKMKISEQNREKSKNKLNSDISKGRIASVILNRKVINDPQCYKRALDFAVQQETIFKKLDNNYSHSMLSGQITHKNLDMIELAINNKPNRFRKVKSSYIGMQKIMKRPSVPKNRGYNVSQLWILQ